MSDEPGPLSDQRAAGDLDPRVGGLLAYLLGWVGGLVMLLTQSDREVRFHGAQSVIVLGGLNALLLLWTLIASPGGGSGFGGRMLFALSWLLIAGLALAIWGFLCFQGYSLVHFKLPFAGDAAERWVAARSGPGGPPPHAADEETPPAAP